MVIRALVWSLVLMFIALPSGLAYIPSTANILRKTIKTHGNSAYQIDQEVQFQMGPRSLLVHEKWIVENGDVPSALGHLNLE